MLSHEPIRYGAGAPVVAASPVSITAAKHPLVCGVRDLGTTTIAVLETLNTHPPAHDRCRLQGCILTQRRHSASQSSPQHFAVSRNRMEAVDWRVAEFRTTGGLRTMERASPAPAQKRRCLRRGVTRYRECSGRHESRAARVSRFGRHFSER